MVYWLPSSEPQAVHIGRKHGILVEILRFLLHLITTHTRCHFIVLDRCTVIWGDFEHLKFGLFQKILRDFIFRACKEIPHKSSIISIETYGNDPVGDFQEINVSNVTPQNLIRVDW